jgi:hypothetical protein
LAWKELVFSSIMLCYFLDSGPSSIDLCFQDEITENPDLTAVRLMTKSTALVKGDSSQQVEKAIIDQLSGPDIYPVDTNYRMVWYNWLIANKFSKDPRIRDTGAVAGLYCIYKKKNEVVIRYSLEIIEKLLKNFVSEINTIEDLITDKLQLPQSTIISQIHYEDFLRNKNSCVLTKKISTILNKEVPESSKKFSSKGLAQTEKFRIILQSMVFKKGTSEEIITQTEKRSYWNSVIERLNYIIFTKLPDLKIGKINKKDLQDVYHILQKEKIWRSLPVNNLHPLISTKDVGDFFFYYWLAHNQILKKKQVLQYYLSLTT